MLIHSALPTGLKLAVFSSIVVLGLLHGAAQTLSGGPAITPPSPLAKTPSTSQQQALSGLTTAQIQKIQAVLTPKLQQSIQSHQASTAANFRSFQSIIHGGSSAQITAQLSEDNSSQAPSEVRFFNDSGVGYTATAIKREYHPAVQASTAINAATTPALSPVQPIPDQDGDGLPDCCDGFESQLAYSFRPEYFISSAEQQQFATYANSVPWTVTNTAGTNPPKSYVHVSPLGLTTNAAGNQLFAIRVDYLSLWNADGGLVGGGAACFYSYFGLDTVINQLSGHVLDAERSVMLLAAPAVNGGYNPDPTAYSLYSIYTAAHEGTFFDQSLFSDFVTPVPAGNHINLSQSLSKHSTYGFNPDFYPITPAWFILSTEEAITAAYQDGDIDYITYLALIAAADDTFYGCLVERFGNQGGDSLSYPVLNVGEVAHPLYGFTFIQDNSSRALGLASKITTRVF